MKLWLSRFRNGDFALSALQPRRCKLIGVDIEEWYFKYGDPIGHRGMCPQATAKIFGAEVTNMKPGDAPVKVELTGRILKRGTSKPRP